MNTPGEEVKRYTEISRLLLVQYEATGNGLARTAADAIDALKAKNAQLRDQDEVHWKARRSLLTERDVLEKRLEAATKAMLMAQACLYGSNSDNEGALRLIGSALAASPETPK